MYRCATKYCKHKITIGNFCSTCRSRKFRENNVLRSTYNNLRNNSKRRGKVFTITLEQFTKFCYETDYLKGKGKTRKSFSIDCYKNELGYTPENIRCIPLGLNSMKGSKSLQYDYQTGFATVVNNTNHNKEFLF